MFFGTDGVKKGRNQEYDQTENQKVEGNSSGYRRFPE
jgi:hypothetical protein